MENFYSEYIKGGYWAIPMIIENSIGLRPTKLLTQLVSEFNFAIKHGYTYDNEFLTNYKRLYRCLNLTMDELNNLIQILAEHKFLDRFTCGIKDTWYIRLYPETILDFKKEQQEKLLFGKWDDGLTYSLNPTNQSLYFESTTLEIKNFIEQHTNNPNAIPIIYYTYFNFLVESYKNELGFSLEDAGLEFFKEKINSERNKENLSINNYKAVFKTMLDFYTNKLNELRDEIEGEPQSDFNSYGS